MTYNEIIAQLPANSKWSCSFGYPGEGGYCEYYRDPQGKRYVIENGDYMALAPFAWTVREA